MRYIDGDTQNNCVTNLKVYSRKEHTSMHTKENDAFCKHNLGKPAWNRGIKMSEEFCRHCSESAKRRWAKV